MQQRYGTLLGAWRTLVLMSTALVAVGVPIAIGTLQPPVLQAQSSSLTATGPSYEVASIKQNRAHEGLIRLEAHPGGRLTATNVSIMMLLRFAYDLPDFQIAGAPAWLRMDSYDMTAKAEGEATFAQQRLLVRRLLADRFKLTVHPEQRELPTYAMTLSRGDGRLGPQLRRTAADCKPVESAQLGMIGPIPPSGPPVCDYFGFAPGTDFPGGKGGMGFRGLTLADFSQRLTMLLRRTVIDRTGLSGHFDGEFDFIAEVPPPPPPPGMPNPFTTPFLTVVTVLPEQLGLKLEAGRSQTQVLVIDSIERPTEN